MVSRNGLPKNSTTGSQSRFVAMVQEVIAHFPDRSRAILMSRFGITGGGKKTLEAIGKEYAITRERVRQVIDAGLKSMRRALAEREEDATLRLLRQEIERNFGIVPMDGLLERLSGESGAERGALLALLHGLPGVRVLKENQERRECIVQQDFSLTEWQTVMIVAKQALSEKHDALILPDLSRACASGLPQDIARHFSSQKLESFLAPSLVVGKNVFGHYGLSEWSIISPRGTRERAYLILKALGKPLHFRELARLIDEYGLARPGKKTHPQTVHNELIKDKRFVLVGRGTYALSIWGYKPGTVRQVLADILKEEQKPMTKEELLRAVMKVRQVKKSTVVINLNAFFTKVGKNIYTLGSKS